MGATQSKTPSSSSFSYRKLHQSAHSNSQLPLRHDHKIRKQKISETDNNRAREKAISENIHAITSGISRIESMHTRIFKEKDKIEAALRKDVNELKIQNGKLEAKVKEQENEVEKLRQRNADLECEIKELKETGTKDNSFELNGTQLCCSCCTSDCRP